MDQQFNLKLTYEEVYRLGEAAAKVRSACNVPKGYDWRSFINDLWAVSAVAACQFEEEMTAVIQRVVDMRSQLPKSDLPIVAYVPDYTEADGKGCAR